MKFKLNLQKTITMKNYLILTFLILVILFSFSCKKDPGKAKIIFYFDHEVDEINLIPDSLLYTNAAGNKYSVDELQYFVSDVVLWVDGIPRVMQSDSNIHYVDIAIPGTLYWDPKFEVETGTADSLTFLFGLSEERNVSGLFVNPPERDMFWPEVMGGGYHYMKMNGRWIDPQQQIQAYNFHMGIGSLTDTSGNMTFVHNCFKVKCELNKLLATEVENRIRISMNIQEWFENPVVWNWNTVGGHIMMNQEAMHNAALNGKDVFSADIVQLYIE